MHRLLNRHTRTLIALLLIVVAAYLADLRFPTVTPKPEIHGFYRVMQVYDGDTIAILMDGTRESVRLIGIDTPELDTPYTKAACFGKEASVAAKQLMGGRMVRIETDPTQDTYDRYARLLAYVYLEDGTFVNHALVAEGFAHEYTYKTPYVHQREFRDAEHRAREERKGLWGVCAAS